MSDTPDDTGYNERKRAYRENGGHKEHHSQGKKRKCGTCRLRGQYDYDINQPGVYRQINGTRRDGRIVCIVGAADRSGWYWVKGEENELPFKVHSFRPGTVTGFTNTIASPIPQPQLDGAGPGRGGVTADESA